MKTKLNKTRLFTALFGAGALTAVCLAMTPSLKAEGEDMMLHKSNIREVIQTVVRNVLNFRSEMPISDDQKTRIRTVVESHKAEIRAQREKGVSARRTFHEAAKIDSESAATLAAADEIGSTARSRALLTAKIRSEVWPILTVDQQKYAEKAIAEVQAAVDKATENVK